MEKSLNFIPNFQYEPCHIYKPSYYSSIKTDVLPPFLNYKFAFCYFVYISVISVRSSKYAVDFNILTSADFLIYTQVFSICIYSVFHIFYSVLNSVYVCRYP